MEEEQEGEREKLDPVSRFLLLGEPAPLELLAKTAHRDPKFEKLLLSGLRRPQMEKRKRNRLMSLALRQKCFSVAKILMRSGGVDINAPLKERRTGRANVVQGGGGGIGLSSPTRNASQVPTTQMAPLPIAPLSNRKGVSLGFQVKKTVEKNAFWCEQKIFIRSSNGGTLALAAGTRSSPSRLRSLSSCKCRRRWRRTGLPPYLKGPKGGRSRGSRTGCRKWRKRGNQKRDLQSFLLKQDLHLQK